MIAFLSAAVLAKVAYVLSGATAVRIWFGKEISAGKVLLAHIGAIAKTDVAMVENVVKTDVAKVEAVITPAPPATPAAPAK